MGKAVAASYLGLAWAVFATIVGDEVLVVQLLLFGVLQWSTSLQLVPKALQGHAALVGRLAMNVAIFCTIKWLEANESIGTTATILIFGALALMYNAYSIYLMQ